MRVILCAIGIVAALNLSSCRGWTSDSPPVHPNPNMDTQNKYKPYRASEFFSDKRSMRPSIEGTVARGEDKLKDDEHFYFGRVGGEPATTFPSQVVIDEAFLKRGQDRFNIYCAVCHSQVGDGVGMVGKRMAIAPTTFHSDYMYGRPVGHYFDVITNGIRTMQNYRDKLNEKDRWAIVAYIRALQISQDADGAWISKASLGR